jgi:hypothetical protein
LLRKLFIGRALRVCGNVRAADTPAADKLRAVQTLRCGQNLRRLNINRRGKSLRCIKKPAAGNTSTAGSRVEAHGKKQNSRPFRIGCLLPSAE